MYSQSETFATPFHVYFDEDGERYPRRNPRENVSCHEDFKDCFKLPASRTNFSWCARLPAQKKNSKQMYSCPRDLHFSAILCTQLWRPLKSLGPSQHYRVWGWAIQLSPILLLIADWLSLLLIAVAFLLWKKRYPQSVLLFSGRIREKKPSSSVRLRELTSLLPFKELVLINAFEIFAFQRLHFN